MNIIRKNFAENLRLLMKDNELSQQRLAKILEVDQTTISAWLRCETEPTLTKVYAIMQYFDVSFEYLTEI